MSSPKNKNTKTPVKSSAQSKAPAAAASKIDPAETAKIAGILTAICLIIALALAGTNLLTADIIAQAALEAKAETCRTVIPADDYISLSENYEGFDNLDAYLAVSGGRIIGAAITTEAKGYGGTVQVMTGIDENGRVSGVSVLEHSETAGLGANAAKPKFLDQFVAAEDQPQPESYAVSKDGGEIDAVTAATISSRAVTNAVNEAVASFELLQSSGIIGSVISLPQPVSPADAPAALPSGTDTAAQTGGAVNE